MIYDRLEDWRKYFREGDPFGRALSFVFAFDPSQPDGRYEIEATDIYVLVSSYETSPASERRFEAHRKYADVQILLEGEETIEVSLARDLGHLEEYNETRDLVYLEPPGDSVPLVMHPGYFAVLYPPEVHRPGCALHGRKGVRKIVLKVRVR